jgi:hypothetical protein
MCLHHPVHGYEGSAGIRKCFGVGISKGLASAHMLHPSGHRLLFYQLVSYLLSPDSK